MIRSSESRRLCTLISRHYELFGSTEMALLHESLSDARKAAEENRESHAFTLHVGSVQCSDALCIDDLVFMMGVVHEFNDASMAEVLLSTNLNPNELYECLSAYEMESVKGVFGKVITSNHMEQALFKAITHQPVVLSTIAFDVAFRDVVSMAGLVGSGVAEDTIPNLLSQSIKSENLGQDVADTISMIGWLNEYLNHSAGLPNQNACQYLRSIGAFHPVLLNKSIADSYVWEHILSKSTPDNLGNQSVETAAMIMRSVSKPEFLNVHGDKVAWMLNSISFGRAEGRSLDKIYREVLSSFHGTFLIEQLESPHFLLGLARSGMNSIFKTEAHGAYTFNQLNSQFPYIATRLKDHWHDLGNKALSAMIGIADEQFGLALLARPLALADLALGSDIAALDKDILSLYLAKTIPLAAHYTREIQNSSEDRNNALPSITHAFQFLIGQAVKSKGFDWSFEKSLTNDERVFMVKAGAPISIFTHTSPPMREQAFTLDLGL